MGGVIIGGLLGCVVKTCSTNQVREYTLVFDPELVRAHILQNSAENQHKDDSAQAPGMPTEKDGYVPPKKWDGKKVKNPNGRGGWGWPDDKKVVFGSRLDQRDMEVLIGMFSTLMETTIILFPEEEFEEKNEKKWN